jgi:hypothetical protein
MAVLGLWGSPNLPEVNKRGAILSCQVWWGGCQLQVNSIEKFCGKFGNKYQKEPACSFYCVGVLKH